jgi:PAS domain S-box-containing protein
MPEPPPDAAPPPPIPPSSIERACELVFRNGPLPMALVGRDGRILDANRAYERLMGWPVADLRQKTFLDLTHPDDRSVGMAELERLHAGEAESMTAEKRYVARDGRVFLGEVVAFAVRDDAEHVAWTVATVRDVTAQREVERRAAEWRRRYDTVVLASRQVLYDWDMRAGTVVRGGAIEQTLGWPADEVGGFGEWLSRIHPGDVDRVRADLALALERHDDLRMVYRWRRGDGRWAWIEDSSYFVVDDQGRPERMVGFMADVTERVAAEQQRQRQEERFRLAVAVASGIVWECDIETRRVWRSEGFTEMLGYAPDEVPNTVDGWISLVHPDDLAQAAIRTLQPRHESEYRVRHKDGRWITVWDRSITQYDAGGRPRAIIGQTVDITERRLAADEIRRLNAELEARVAARTTELVRMNRELEAFTYSVSHDLRAPLRHVAGFAELLRQRAGASLDPESRRYLENVLDASARMGELIDRLLELSHLGRAPLALQPVEPAALAREIVAELAPHHAGRMIEWRIGAAPAVRADPALLRIVLSNILHNAVKYTAARPSARIEVRGRALAEGMVELEIEDNGAGFDMRHVDRLFGVFERLHPAGEYEGWGVGLASVQRIVARHGGAVRGRGRPGHGATFTVVLPAAAPVGAAA